MMQLDHYRRTSMFVCGNVSGRQRAGYLAWALVMGMAPLLPSGGAHAQGMNMKDMPGMKKDMPAKKGEATKTATATGTVTAMDTAKRKVTLDHGPIPDINWPAMKMEFSVAPSVDLSKVKTGDQVRFTLSGSGNSYIVQSINPGQ
jgi:Cu/Ag efflux protein CusF